MDTGQKNEAVLSTIPKSPTNKMALASKMIKRTAAFAVMESVFPYDEYASAASTLAFVTQNSSTVTVGSLFDVVASLKPGLTDESYMYRLIGRLCMENVGAYEDLEALSKESHIITMDEMKKLPEESRMTYHMRVCYCQGDE